MPLHVRIYMGLIRQVQEFSTGWVFIHVILRRFLLVHIPPRLDSWISLYGYRSSSDFPFLSLGV